MGSDLGPRDRGGKTFSERGVLAKWCHWGGKMDGDEGNPALPRDRSLREAYLRGQNCPLHGRAR